MQSLAMRRLGWSGWSRGSSIRRHPQHHHYFLKRHAKHRQFSSSSSSSSNNQLEQQKWLLSLLGRGLSAFGLIHVVSEYGVELTACEGPSMMPTIQPQGEIILVDRLTPRIYGLQGGGSGQERAQRARDKQQQYESVSGSQNWHQPKMPCATSMSRTKGAWKRLFQKSTSGIHVGDVVVVQHPNRAGTVCKRVLGLPGDVVVDPPRHLLLLLHKSHSTSLLVIPDGHVWIEGDNSVNSSDSRNYGPVSAALVVGRVLCRVWPLRGSAIMERAARPEPLPSQPFSGSIILPAGYQGEAILYEPPNKSL